MCAVPHIRLLVLIFMGAYSATPATAIADDTTINLVGGAVPFVLHPEQKGPHNLIYDTTLIEVADGPLKRTMLPYARALRDFQAHEFDCIYATTNNTFYFAPSLVEEGRLLFSRPVNTIKLHTYTRLETPAIQSLQDLKGKTLVGTKNQLRAVRQQLGPDDARFITVFDAPKAFELVEKKRADVAVVYNMDARLTVPGAIARYGDVQLPETIRYHYDPDFAPIEWGEILACWATPATKRYMQNFNKQINFMEDMGALSSIFSAFH